MTRYLTALLWACGLIIASCGKSDNAVKPKTAIERILIAPEMVIQKTGVAYNIVIRYFKDYTDRDQVSVTVNGQSGTMQGEWTGTIEGTNMLFSMQPVAHAGDLTVKVAIDNGQKIFEQEQVLRFVDEYTLSKVWSALQKEYLSAVASTAERSKTGEPAVNSFIYGEPWMNLGNYFRTVSPNMFIKEKPFIPGLSGVYISRFDNGVLQELKVIHGAPALDPSYRPQDTHAEIAAMPGTVFVSEQVLSNDHKATTYHHQEFTLTLHETPIEVYTSITKR